MVEMTSSTLQSPSLIYYLKTMWHCAWSLTDAFFNSLISAKLMSCQEVSTVQKPGSQYSLQTCPAFTGERKRPWGSFSCQALLLFQGWKGSGWTGRLHDLNLVGPIVISKSISLQKEALV